MYGTFFNQFCVARLKNIFPNMHASLQIAVILQISNCSVDKTFPNLMFVNTKLTTTMKEERLEGLLKSTREARLSAGYSEREQ